MSHVRVEEGSHEDPAGCGRAPLHACNGHGEPAVALTVTIQFHATAREGRRLVGEARQTRQGKRAGFYAMTVTDEADGTVVATCQAVSLRTKAV